MAAQNTELTYDVKAKDYGTLGKLPTEIILYILNMLSVAELGSVVPRLNRSFEALSVNDQLWRKFLDNPPTSFSEPGRALNFKLLCKVNKSIPAMTINLPSMELNLTSITSPLNLNAIMPQLFVPATNIIPADVLLPVNKSSELQTKVAFFKPDTTDFNQYFNKKYRKPQPPHDNQNSKDDDPNNKSLKNE